MHSVKKIWQIVLFFSIIVLFSCCEVGPLQQYGNKDGRIFLTDWEYTLDGETYSPLELKYLERLYKVTPGRKGYVTLRTTVKIPEELKYDELAINFGSVYIAAKFFIDGKQTYSVGYFPPNAFTSGKQTHCVKIPENALQKKDTITVSIVFWIDGSGGMTGVPFVAPYDDVSLATQYQSFILSKIYFAFAVFGILAMVCFYSMYLQNKKEREYMSFSLINICTALFLYPYYVNEIPGVVGIIGMLKFARFFKGIMVLAVAYYDACFVRDFLKCPESKKVYWIRVAMFIAPCILIDFVPNLVVYYTLQHLIFVFAALQLFFAIKPIVWAFKENKEGLRVLFLGFSPVLASFIVDVIIHGFLRYNMLPLFTMYGWQLTILAFLVIVATRYAKFRKQAEYLNAKLEKEIEERTVELRKANAELEEQHKQAVRDMALAVHVQKAFYPQDTDFLGWDVAIAFEPASGISGDVYDFYVLEGKLRGFGLFDVSGHGISSGLVTMLAKNAIFHSFRTTLPLKFNEAVMRINDAVIRTKGNIENYLVGCITRIDKDDSSKMELINTGGPYPVFKSAKKNKARLIKPNSKKPQFGMLGVAGIEVQFQTIKISINEGDVLVLYTDGITESENSEGEQYGNERLRKSIEKASGSAQEILDYIISEFSAFIGVTPVDDDITILVMKKTVEVIEDEDLGALDEVFDAEV